MVSEADRRQLVEFLDNSADRALLGLVYGRRRIGKSTLLVEQTMSRGGFYFEATRVETPAQLRRLGAAVGEYQGTGRLAFDSWEEAVDVLVQLGKDRRVPVVLDEFGLVLQADPAVDSVLAAALGPAARARRSSAARVVLCGSAIAMMRSLTAGEAPLRGRSSLELVMQPDDFRVAATRLSGVDLDLAVRVFSVIGGVVGYATDMVAFDLPGDIDDFDRWVVERVLSPASPLHHEATTLLAEDPTLAASSDLLHHAVLGAIANGAVTAGTISTQVGRPVSNLSPTINRLVDAGFVVRHEDPVRKQRPLYALADPYLQFHYAVLEPHRTVLRSRDLHDVWANRLRTIFDARVRGPVFEQMARTWVERFAAAEELGGVIDHVGPSFATIDGVEHELDVVVAAGDGAPAERTIVAIGEAKAGETITARHVARLERARASFGPRASAAKLMLFGADFGLGPTERDRPDVVLVDLSRLHGT